MIPNCEAQIYLESRGEIHPCNPGRKDALPSGKIIAVVLLGNGIEQNNVSLLRQSSTSCEERNANASAHICSVSYPYHLKSSSRQQRTETSFRAQSEGQLILRYNALSKIEVPVPVPIPIPISGEGNGEFDGIILDSLQTILSNTNATLEFYINSCTIDEGIIRNVETYARSQAQHTQYGILQRTLLLPGDKSCIKGFVFSLSPNAIRKTKQIYVPYRIPIPLLSISLEQTGGRKIFASDSDDSSKVKGTQRDILLQLCLKRLMIGTIVICPITEEYTVGFDRSCSGRSIISLKVPSIHNHKSFEESFEYRVGSVLPHLQASWGSNLHNSVSNIFLILPSTRITLTHLGVDSDSEAGVVPPEKITNICESMPGTEELILETISCIRQVHSFVLPRNKTSNSYHGSIDIPRAFLLSGPPGVGKTYAVKMAVEAANAQGGTESTRLVSIRGSEILSLGANEAEAALALQRVIMTAVDFASKDIMNISLIFMDECDALLSSDIAGSTLAALLDQMSSNLAMPKSNHANLLGWKRVVVIAATNRIDAIPSSLRRPGRFDRELSISPPNKEQRFNILASLLCELEPDKNESSEQSSVPSYMDRESLQEVADQCVGYVAADLSALVRRAAFLSIREGLPHVSCTYLKGAMRDVGASALRDSAINSPPSTRWDDIAGDAGGAKTALRRAVEWPQTKKKDFARLGLAPPRGILLHGPPGCAKTTLARAAAGAAGVAFLSLSPADVYASSYVGEAEAVVRRAFSLARSASPCILFFDEIDSIVAASDSNKSGMDRGNNAEARVLSTFLNEMDGVDGSISDGVLVLGATNRPGTLDSALLRPGRFDKVIYVPNPDREGRQSIIDAQCCSWEKNGAACNIDTAKLSSDAITGMMTGAEIVGACREAAMLAIRESLENGGQSMPVVLYHHLEASLIAVKPLLSNASVLSEYTSFEEEYSK